MTATVVWVAAATAMLRSVIHAVAWDRGTFKLLPRGGSASDEVIGLNSEPAPGLRLVSYGALIAAGCGLAVLGAALALATVLGVLGRVEAPSSIESHKCIAPLDGNAK